MPQRLDRLPWNCWHVFVIVALKAWQDRADFWQDIQGARKGLLVELHDARFSRFLVGAVDRLADCWWTAR